MDKVIWTNEFTPKEWKVLVDNLRENENYNDLEDEFEMVDIYLNGLLQTERINLNIDVGSPIIVITDLGLWNGEYKAYKFIRSGNIADCLYDGGDSVKWYVDRYKDLRCRSIHHDGRNHYLYRAVKPGVSDYTLRRFCGKILDGTVTREDITRVTRRLGDYIGKVYGW